MTYDIRHSTAYDYEHDVSLSHHVGHLTPRETPTQRCLQHRLDAFPRITTSSTHPDHFGNLATFLTVEGAHRRLEIIAGSRVEILLQPSLIPESTPPWESIRDLCSLDSEHPPLEPAEFVFGS